MDLKTILFILGFSFPYSIFARSVPGASPVPIEQQAFDKSGLPAYTHDTEGKDDVSGQYIASGEKQKDIAAEALQNALASLSATGTCTKDNIEVRIEWRNMPKEERKAYTDAIQCLQSRPSILDQAKYEGAKTRYDDFVAVHIEQTFEMHFSANFLTWHRYFVWVYHQTLKSVCSYNGRIPYWEWGLDVASPRDSPLFNGDEYSLGSDGAPEPHGQLPILVFYVDQDNTIQNTTLNVPPGTGGGCVFAGPFSNYTVNMGPLHSATGPPVNSTFAYNPRCLKRDLSPVTATNWTSFANYTPIQTDASDITKFQSLIDGDPRDPANVLNIGPHGGGHFSLSGDPGADFQTSPGDPHFFVHHAQLDRVYWIWQNLKNQQERKSTIPNRTRTLLDLPPSPQGELSDPIDFGPLAEVITNKDTLDTLSGAPFCYVYE